MPTGEGYAFKNLVMTGTDPRRPGARRCAGADPHAPDRFEDDPDDLWLAFVILPLNG